MKNSVITGLILFGLLTAQAIGQDVIKVDEALKWFPQGTYTNIEHFDVTQFLKGKTAGLYEKYFLQDHPLFRKEEPAAAGEAEQKGETKTEISLSFVSDFTIGDMISFRHLNLPDALYDGITSYTLASFTDLATEPEDNSKYEVITDAGEDGKGKKASVAFFISEGDYLHVLRYDDAATTIQSALEKGVLSATGKKIAGRPVYSFSDSPDQDRKKGRFLWVSPTNEVLLAGSIENLRKMVKTESGLMMSLLDDEDYVELVQIAPDLGCRWNVHSLKKTDRKLEEVVMEEGLSEEQAERIKATTQNTPLFTATGWKVGQELIGVTAKVFSENELAETAGKKASSGSGISGGADLAALQQLKRERTTIETRGNVFWSFVNYDKKLLDSQKNFMAKAQNLMIKDGKSFQVTAPDGGKMEVQLDQKSGNIVVTKKKKN